MKHQTKKEVSDDPFFYDTEADADQSREPMPLDARLLCLLLNPDLIAFVSKVRADKTLVKRKLSAADGWCMLHLLAAMPDDFYSVPSSPSSAPPPLPLSILSRIQELFTLDRRALELADARGRTPLYHAAANCRLQRFFFLLDTLKPNLHRYSAREDRTILDALQSAVLSRVAPHRPNLSHVPYAPPVVLEIDASPHSSALASSSHSLDPDCEDSLPYSNLFSLLQHSITDTSNPSSSSSSLSSSSSSSSHPLALMWPHHPESLPPSAFVCHPHLGQLLRARAEASTRCAVWGQHSDAVLGHQGALFSKKHAAEYRPICVAKHPSSPLAAVFTSARCSAAIAASGALYVWGSPAAGALGEALQLSPSPSRPPALKGVAVSHVALSDGHVLVTTAQGLLFSAGDNAFGQLGHQKRRPGMHQVEALAGVRVRMAAAGRAHSLCVAQDGRALYAWGCNAQGQLGVALKPPSKSSSAAPTSTHVPSRVELPGKFGVLFLAAGEAYSAAVAANGDVFWWGCGKASPARVNFPFGTPGAVNARVMKRNSTFALQEPLWHVSSFSGNDTHLFVVALAKLYWFRPGERTPQGQPAQARVFELPSSRKPLAVFAGSDRMAVVLSDLRTQYFRLTKPAQGVGISRPEADPQPNAALHHRATFVALGRAHTLVLELRDRVPSAVRVDAEQEYAHHMQQLFLHRAQSSDLHVSFVESNNNHNHNNHHNHNNNNIVVPEQNEAHDLEFDVNAPIIPVSVVVHCHAYVLEARGAFKLLERIRAGPLASLSPDAFTAVLGLLYHDQALPDDVKALLDDELRDELQGIDGLSRCFSAYYGTLQGRQFDALPRDLVRVCSQTQAFCCHRSLLRERSEYFHAMFASGMIEANGGTMTLSCPGWVLSAMLGYLYSGKIPSSAGWSVEQWLIVYMAADQYQMTSMIKKCLQNMLPLISGANVYDLLELTEDNYADLRQICVEFCALNLDQLLISNIGARPFSATEVAEIQEYVLKFEPQPDSWSEMLECINLTDLSNIPFETFLDESSSSTMSHAIPSSSSSSIQNESNLSSVSNESISNESISSESLSAIHDHPPPTTTEASSIPVNDASSSIPIPTDSTPKKIEPALSTSPLSTSPSTSESTSWRTRSMPISAPPPKSMKEIMRDQQRQTAHPPSPSSRPTAPSGALYSSPRGSSSPTTAARGGSSRGAMPMQQPPMARRDAPQPSRSAPGWRTESMPPPRQAPPPSVPHQPTHLLPATSNWAATSRTPVSKRLQKQMHTKTGLDPFDRMQKPAPPAQKMSQPKPSFACPVCNRKFGTEQGTLQHFDEVHGD